MKVLLLALITSLFSLSIVPVNKNTGRADKKPLCNTPYSVYTTPVIFDNNKSVQTTNYVLNNNVNITAKVNVKAVKMYNAELLNTKTFNAQNPQIEKFRL